MTHHTLKLALLALPLLALLSLAPARADDCSGFSLRTIASGPTWVELRHERDGWRARITRGPSETAPWKPLDGLEPYREHGHLNLVQGRAGTGFAVIDGGSELGDDAKILVYAPDGTLRANWGFKDFMTADDLKSVRRSISHTQWLASEDDNIAIAADGRTVHIELLSGRVLTLVLGERTTIR